MCTNLVLVRIWKKSNNDKRRKEVAEGKVAAHLCLTPIIKQIRISVEHDRVVATLNIISTKYHIKCSGWCSLFIGWRVAGAPKNFQSTLYTKVACALTQKKLSYRCKRSLAVLCYFSPFFFMLLWWISCLFVRFNGQELDGTWCVGSQVPFQFVAIL
jgi:hypothetical protein